jgi:hypothetical protein
MNKNVLLVAMKVILSEFGEGTYAYLTLIYEMNVPEELKCKAVRLVAEPLRSFDIDAFRIEESWFRGILRRVFRQ